MSYKEILEHEIKANDLATATLVGTLPSLNKFLSLITICRDGKASLKRNLCDRRTSWRTSCSFYQELYYFVTHFRVMILQARLVEGLA